VESAAISPPRNDGAKLINAARKRNGFDEGLTRRIVQLSSNHRKIANVRLPISRRKSWTLERRINRGKDDGVPLVAAATGSQFEFVEWTEGAHLRHTQLVRLREDDKKVKDEKRQR